MSGNLKGALLLMLAAAVFTGEVLLVRLAGDEAATSQIVFFRAFAQLLLGTAMVVAARGGFGTKRPGLQIARGLTSLGVWSLYYISFLLLDLALASTLTFSTSLFVALLAAPVLAERIGAAPEVIRYLVGQTLHAPLYVQENALRRLGHFSKDSRGAVRAALDDFSRVGAPRVRGRAAEQRAALAD